MLVVLLIFATGVALDQAVGVTGGVLPVLVRDGWQVETVWLDRGTGLREWIEIRHQSDTMHCGTRAESDALLRAHGLDPAGFVEATTVEDGCE